MAHEILARNSYETGEFAPMASAAQIDANSRNAQQSCWPKSDDGKDRVRRNSIKHGLTARTIVPDLLSECPGPLDQRAQEWISDLQPRNAIERGLVLQAAGLMDALEHGERIEKQMLIAWWRTQIRELGRRLLYVAGPEHVKVDKQPPWSDDPGQLVQQLEEFAEGCRWLLERWEEYRNLLDRELTWNEAVLIRFISTDDKIGILSHEGQGEGAGHCVPDEVAGSEKAQNKPIWNPGKARKPSKSSQKPPGRRGENKANPETNSRVKPEWPAADGGWPLPPKAASCCLRRVLPHSVARTSLVPRVAGR